MKLLFDENLPPSLCRLLSDEFPESENVLTSGLGGKSDRYIAEYAETGGFAVATKDADFVDLVLADERNVKVVRIALGNCTVESVYLLLKNSSDLIIQFGEGPDLVLKLP